jgi:tetratricopeptide (TPR) repeat protein
MLDDYIKIFDRSVSVEIKSKKHLFVKGKSEINDKIFFDIENENILKNFILTFNLNSKMNTGERTIKFYYRFVDEKNYCVFSIKDGQSIKFEIVGNGEDKIQTSWIKITEENLFDDKLSFILSVFEETTTVIMDESVVLNIEHTPETEGKIGIQFLSGEKDEFNLTLEDFSISSEVLQFQPILEMPKKPDAFFMVANDFYEQDRYDLALFYYKRGLIYGAADDKIYNRIGNLYYLIEEFENAKNYYFTAMNNKPEKKEYKINYGRSLLSTNKVEEAKIIFEELLNEGIEDVELFVDYATLLMKKKIFSDALIYLGKASELSKDNFAILSKIGKCLITLDQIDEGKKNLLQAAKILEKQDPSSSVIVLKYSIEKKIDTESVKLLSKILERSHEYKEIYDLIKKCRFEIEFDSEMLDLLINSELELEMYDQAIEEFKKYDDEEIVPRFRFLKAKALIYTGNYEDAEKDLNTLFEMKDNKDISINELVYLKIVLCSRTSNYDNLAKVYKMVQKDKPFYENVVVEYGKILVDVGKFEEAIKVLESIKENFKDDAEYLYNLGLAYSGIGDHYEAKNHLVLAFKRSENPEIVLAFVNVLFYTKDYHEAISIIESYSKILPKDGRIENMLGNIYLALNNIQVAQSYYYKALEIDDQNEEFGLNLAELFYKIKDYQNAYMITSQIVKKNSFDRAKALHLRVKSHIYNTLNCDSCKTEWDFSKEAGDVNFNPENFASLPDTAPAGVCPKCGKIYCKACVKGAPLIDAKCPVCSTVLNYNLPGLRIIASGFLKPKKTLEIEPMTDLLSL